MWPTRHSGLARLAVRWLRRRSKRAGLWLTVHGRLTPLWQTRCSGREAMWPREHSIAGGTVAAKAKHAGGNVGDTVHQASRAEAENAKEGGARWLAGQISLVEHWLTRCRRPAAMWPRGRKRQETPLLRGRSGLASLWLTMQTGNTLTDTMWQSGRLVVCNAQETGGTAADNAKKSGGALANQAREAGGTVADAAQLAGGSRRTRHTIAA